MSDFDTIHLRSTEPLILAFQFGEDPDFGGNLTTLLPVEGEPRWRRIARMPATTEAAAHIGGIIVNAPRVVLYQGTKADPGLVAMVYAAVKAIEVDAEDAAWKPDSEVGIYLGTVVRYAHDMDPTRTLQQECEDHFKAILGGKTVSPVDKALEALMKGKVDG